MIPPAHKTHQTNARKKEAQSLRDFGVIREPIPSESSDAPTDDSSEEEVTANNLLEFSSNAEEDDEEIEQNPDRLYSENTAFSYFGMQSSLKQFNPMKPIKRRLKLWCRADMSGYVYQFDVYQGKQTDIDK
ncbi:hypothetical protein TNCV_3054611 [Trichonephila clavipes]|nr:hypothetical protein TNCV_3054611 [Trichonephila clavipes]